MYTKKNIQNETTTNPMHIKKEVKIFTQSNQIMNFNKLNLEFFIKCFFNFVITHIIL